MDESTSHTVIILYKPSCERCVLIFNKVYFIFFHMHTYYTHLFLNVHTYRKYYSEYAYLFCILIFWVCILVFLVCVLNIHALIGQCMYFSHLKQAHYCDQGHDGSGACPKNMWGGRIHTRCNASVSSITCRFSSVQVWWCAGMHLCYPYQHHLSLNIYLEKACVDESINLSESINALAWKQSPHVCAKWHDNWI